MKRPKHDDFDSFLTETFQELAQSIVPPSSTAMWDKLQQHNNINNSELQADELQTLTNGLQALDEETDKQAASKEKERKDKAHPGKTWKKYVFPAGIAAACIFLIIALTSSSINIRNIDQFFGASQSPSPVQFNADYLTASEFEESKSDMQLTTAANEGLQSEAKPSEEGGQATEQADNLYPYNTVVGGLGPAAPEMDQTIPWDNMEYLHNNSGRAAAITPEDRGRSVFEMASLGDYHPIRSPEVLSWLEESSFFNALSELSETNDNIYYFPELPDNYTFRLGNITSDNRALQKIHQEFEGEKGIITFNQRFFAEEADALDIIETARTANAPYRFKSISAYIATPSPETTNLTWKEGSSVLEISGDLDNVLLEEFLNYMAKIK